MAGFVQPVTQALFLFAIRSGSGADFHQHRARQIANLIVLVASALAGLCVYIFAGSVVFVLGGAQFLGAVPVLRVLTAIPVLTTLTSLLGPNTLLAAGAEKSFASSQLVAAFVSLPVIVGLSFAFGALGAAWSMVIAELLLVYFFAQELKRHHLLGQVFGGLPEPPATRA
jgi:PST family polysaccharide transporter